MRVNVGHNLKFFVATIAKYHPWKAVVVLGWLSGDNIELKINLPGMKRHIGETTLECAIWETQKERSIKLSL